MKYIKHSLILSMLFLFMTPFLFGQETEEKKVVDKPVRSPFESSMLIDFGTSKNVSKGGFEMLIHHRFGTFGNGFSDLHGIFAPSNIRMGVQYGLRSNLSIGFGTEKNNKMQEFNLRWNILQQTRSGRIPVAVTYYGNVVIDSRNEEVFGVKFEGSNRLSYFNQILISRKFTSRLSAQVGWSFTHFNSVDSLLEHDRLAFHFGGRMKLWSDNSFIAEYTMPLNIDGLANYPFVDSPKDGVSLGIEFGTSTHAFQVFVSNYQQIVPQRNIAYNQNEFFEGDILLGFNITVRL
jgi:hypothetical protein